MFQKEIQKQHSLVWRRPRWGHEEGPGTAWGGSFPAEERMDRPKLCGAQGLYIAWCLTCTDLPIPLMHLLFFKQGTSLPLFLGQTLLFCLQWRGKQFCSQELPVCGGNKKINDKLINCMCGKRYKVKIMPHKIIAGLIFYKVSQCRNEGRHGISKRFKAKDSKIWPIPSHRLSSNSTLPNPMKPHRYKDISMRT